MAKPPMASFCPGGARPARTGLSWFAHSTNWFIHRPRRFWQLEREGASPAGSPLVRASRSSNPFELPPPFGSGCGGCCKPKFWEATHG